MSNPIRALIDLVKVPIRFHFFGGMAAVVAVILVMSNRISDRHEFADSELHEDVIDRWGAPVLQPAPSVRFVPAGSTFTSLKPLVLDKQQIVVDTRMNYRKRGLVYYSGFDFAFDAQYAVTNDTSMDVDAVIVVPLLEDNSRMLLTDLRFTVNGEPKPSSDFDDRARFVWTARLARGESLAFGLSYKGRGLEVFKYALDPALPARNVAMTLKVQGGENIDYPIGVAPASEVTSAKDGVTMVWRYTSLESGIDVGAILPTQQAYDDTILTIIGRSWAPYLVMFAALVLLCLRSGKTLKIYQSYLTAAIYGFHFVLLAYLAAFMNFYAAFALTTAIIGTLYTGYLMTVFGRRKLPQLVGLYAAALVVPSVAVMCEGYTGLFYCFEILIALLSALILTSKDDFGRVVEGLAMPALRVLVGILLVGAVALPALAADDGGSANLSLKEYEALRTKVDALEKDAKPADAVYDSALFTGRFSGEHLELSAAFHLTMRGKGTKERRLLKLSDAFVLTGVDEPDNGSVKVSGSDLVFVGDGEGGVEVNVKLLAFGAGAGKQQLALAVPGATCAQAALSYDGAMFAVDAVRQKRLPDGLMVLPKDGVLSFSWAPKAAAAAIQSAQTRAAPRAVDPVVERSEATMVITQDGRSILQMRLTLKLSEVRALTLDLGPDLEPESVLVNDAPIAFKREGEKLVLKIGPAALGNDQASVELLARKRGRPFLLSGQTSLVLPKVDLLTNTVDFRLFLPAIFEYKVRGGSFTPLEAGKEAAPRYAKDLPTPGKEFAFRQQLVADAGPYVELSYAVDLGGQYFKGVSATK